jgi:hypothetical protein
MNGKILEQTLINNQQTWLPVDGTPCPSHPRVLLIIVTTANCKRIYHRVSQHRTFNLLLYLLPNLLPRLVQFVSHVGLPNSLLELKTYQNYIVMWRLAL